MELSVAALRSLTDPRAIQSALDDLTRAEVQVRGRRGAQGGQRAKAPPSG